jgi:hypothetical protein
VPVIAGAFLIIGGLLGFLSTWLVEGRKTKEALRTRFADELLEVTSSMTGRASELIDVGREIIHALEKPESSTEARAAELSRMREPIVDALLNESWRLELIAPKHVRDASLELLKKAMIVAISHDEEKLTNSLGELAGANESMRLAIRTYFNVDQ